MFVVWESLSGVAGWRRKTSRFASQEVCHWNPAILFERVNDEVMYAHIQEKTTKICLRGGGEGLRVVATAVEGRMQ